MNKLIIILLSTVLISGCVSNRVKVTNYTSQDLSKASQIEFGMSKEEVKNIMSSPIKTEFASDIEAWHWCNTGIDGEHHEFVVVLFSNNKIVVKNNYSVTLTDVGGAIGSCSEFVKSALN